MRSTFLAYVLSRKVLSFATTLRPFHGGGKPCAYLSWELSCFPLDGSFFSAYFFSGKFDLYSYLIYVYYDLI